MKLYRLEELRRKHNMNQIDVADILGVSRTTYSMYELGNREMDYESLLKLADHYKVTIDYIFGRSDIPIHLDSYAPDEVEFMVKSLDIYKEIKSKYQ